MVVRSRGADRVCRLSVDHRNFTQIDADESFKCTRTECRLLKYEHLKKYTFKGELFISPIFRLYTEEGEDSRKIKIKLKLNVVFV